jgi:hypothetical protein
MRIKIFGLENKNKMSQINNDDKTYLIVIYYMQYSKLVQVRSVGNTLTLHKTALIEAFNLKAGIEYLLKNYEAAREALTDMPPRSEDELDAVTLHNQGCCVLKSSLYNNFRKIPFFIYEAWINCSQ